MVFHSLLMLCIMVGIVNGMPDPRSWVYVYTSAATSASTHVTSVATAFAYVIWIFEMMLALSASAALFRIVSDPSRDVHTCMFLYATWYVVNGFTFAMWMTGGSPFLALTDRIPTPFLPGGVQNLCPRARVHSVTPGNWDKETCAKLSPYEAACCGTIDVVEYEGGGDTSIFFSVLLFMSNCTVMIITILASRAIKAQLQRCRLVVQEV